MIACARSRDRHAGQNRQRSTRADAGDFDQLLEDVAFFRGAETEQDVRVLAYSQMREQHDFFIQARQIVERAHRHLDFVTDTVAIDQQLRRIFLKKNSGKTTNHRDDLAKKQLNIVEMIVAEKRVEDSCQSSMLSDQSTAAHTQTFFRQIRRQRANAANASPLCAWQIATPSASAASVPGKPDNFSSRCTMSCTCAFCALPWPTTACLTCRAVYSATSKSAPTNAQIAAPRAWPSNSVDCGLTLTKTFSIAAQSGR